MSKTFRAKIKNLNSKMIIHIPDFISRELPSRGMVMVKGRFNDVEFEAPLEPDGKGSHWFEVPQLLQKSIKVQKDESVDISIEPMEEWSEPEMPLDFLETLRLENLEMEWNGVTTKAKWDWLRWIRSTKNPETRKKRIEVACSKLHKGDKRPCCFNRNMCTVTEVSKSGVLLD